jgi:hypothetical protein
VKEANYVGVRSNALTGVAKTPSYTQISFRKGVKIMTVEEIKIELQRMVPSFATKIAPFYQTLEWRWSTGKSKPHVPSASEIENEFYSLIEGLGTGDRHEVSAGGLTVYYRMPDKSELGCYGLAFECSEEAHFD